ncbi:MAG: hypothetical protein VW879_01890 [Opitutae bacterium]
MKTLQDDKSRFESYYIDYLENHETIASYAAAHNLTYKTAELRIEAGRKVHQSMTGQVYQDTLAASGLSSF